MALGFRKFISKVFVNGKFPKILPSENSRYTVHPFRDKISNRNFYLI